MSTSPRASQTRLPLAESLSKHDQRPASTLVAWQFAPSITASAAMPTDKDCALVDATAGAVNITLPAGSDEIIGLPFGAYKTDVSANAAGILCAGSNTFADATTSLTTTTQGAFVGATWDGTYWRPLVSVGASAASLTATTSVVVGGTGAGTAAATLTLNKTAAGTSAVVYKEANAIRAKAGLDASENYVIEVFTGAAGAEASGGSITISPAGAVTFTGAVTIAIAAVRSAADDAAAALLVPAVPVGGLYRTLSGVKIRVS